MIHSHLYEGPLIRGFFVRRFIVKFGSNPLSWPYPTHEVGNSLGWLYCLPRLRLLRFSRWLDPLTSEPSDNWAYNLHHAHTSQSRHGFDWSEILATNLQPLNIVKLEQRLSRQLVAYLKDHDLLPSRQSAYRTSCTLHLFPFPYILFITPICVMYKVDSWLFDLLRYYTLWVRKKLDFFHLSITLANNSFTVTDENYLLRNIIICNWICNFTYTLLLHNLEKCNHIHFFTENFE